MSLTCEQTGLVQFGELTTLDREITVDIGQVNWSGDVGIFWGYNWAVTVTPFLPEIIDARKKGFIRARIDGEIIDITKEVKLNRYKRHKINGKKESI